jgi:CO/xanthine dehydrogenase Mo-binding subunit
LLTTAASSSIRTACAIRSKATSSRASTLIEEVGFNGAGVTTLLWSSYPVVHFNQVPSSIEIVLINHPDQLTQAPDNVPAWGAGEPTIGPVAPAIANAIFNAIGKRLTVLPITPQRVSA